MFIVYYDIFSQRVRRELVDGKISDERLFAIMKKFCEEIPVARAWFVTHNVTQFGNLLFGVPTSRAQSIYEMTKRRAERRQDVASPSTWGAFTG